MFIRVPDEDGVTNGEKGLVWQRLACMADKCSVGEQEWRAVGVECERLDTRIGLGYDR